MSILRRVSRVWLPPRAGVAAWLRSAVPGVREVVSHFDEDVDRGVECPVRYERGPRHQQLYRFWKEMGREKLLKVMHECRDDADEEPFCKELRRRLLPMWRASDFPCGLRKVQRYCGPALSAISELAEWITSLSFCSGVRNSGGSCKVLLRTIWRLTGRAPSANLDEDEVVEDVTEEGTVEAEGSPTARAL